MVGRRLRNGGHERRWPRIGDTPGLVLPGPRELRRVVFVAAPTSDSVGSDVVTELIVDPSTEPIAVSSVGHRRSRGALEDVPADLSEVEAKKLDPESHI